MIDDPLSPWDGVEMPSDIPAPDAPPVARRTPQDQRALQAAEVLAGLRGNDLDRAVTFRDLQRLEEALVGQRAGVTLSRDVVGSITGTIQQQLTAINSESGDLVAQFNELFDAATEDISSLGVVVDGNLTSLGTTLNGNFNFVSQLDASVDGILGVHGVRINTNGHITGYSLISQAVDGGVQSDFIIVDANFRVVETSGGSARTPFAVYATPRVVDGVFVPAGVYADQLNVLRANIGFLAVDTLRIQDNAVTLPEGETRTDDQVGRTNPQILHSYFFDNDEPQNVLIIWSGRADYVGVDLGVGYATDYSIEINSNQVVARGGIAIEDSPNMFWLGPVVGDGNIIRVFMSAEGNKVTAKTRSLAIIGIRK